MLIIELDDKKENEIKDIFIKWFYRKDNFQKFLKILKEDKELKNIIFNEIIQEKLNLDDNVMKEINEDLCKESKIEEIRNVKEIKKILEEFFFSKFSYDIKSQKYTSKYVKETLGLLSEETIDYFYKKYENFRNSQGAKIAKALDIGVCPYCNRNYIDIYSKNKKLYFKGELDHYYPKSKYPHLALSLFNMIPVCKTCNHEKNDINNKQGLYPYRNKGEDYCNFELSWLTENDKYDITYQNEILKEKQYDFTYLMGISDNFKIELKSKDIEHKEIISYTEELFNLNKKYNNINSKAYVKNLLRKRYIFNESYLESISETFELPKEAKQVLFSIDLEEPNFNERPFSKLTYDILKKFEYNNEED